MPLSSQPIASERLDEQYAAGGKRYVKSARSDDRGSETREEQSSIAPGRVARISLAILVDAQRAADLYKIRALSAAAAGIDLRRGDTVTVQAVAFHTGRAPRFNGWLAAYGLASGIAPPVVACGALLVALNMCLKPATRLLRSIAAKKALARKREALSGFAPSQVRGALAGEPPHTAAAIISALPAATAAAVLDLYPAHERSAIIRRMSRSQSSLIPEFETVIANA
ncbi:MAG: hypothetical protein NVS9B12_07540 [Vulcanimicrobiaceae bacterium]